MTHDHFLKFTFYLLYTPANVFMEQPFHTYSVFTFRYMQMHFSPEREFGICNYYRLVNSSCNFISLECFMCMQVSKRFVIANLYDYNISSYKKGHSKLNVYFKNSKHNILYLPEKDWELEKYHSGKALSLVSTAFRTHFTKQLFPKMQQIIS